MNKLVKIMMITVILVGIVFVILLGILFFSLPSPADLSKKIYDQNSRVNLELSEIKEKKLPSSKDQTNEIKIDGQDKTSVDSKSQSRQLLFDLLDEKKPYTSVCSSLNKINQKQTGKMSTEEFGHRFAMVVQNQSSDPLLESIKPILKFTLMQPEIKNLISQIENAKNESEISSITSKADFYHGIYKAYQEMVQNKPRMEGILNESYLAMMLGRLVERYPQILESSDVMAYCGRLEMKINNSEGNGFIEDREDFANFLREANIAPEAIGFNPQYETDLKIVYGKNGLHFNGGWIDEVFANLESRRGQSSKKTQ